MDDPTDVGTRKAIGKAIEVARRTAGLSQVALAQAARSDQAKISRYEHGENLPSVDLILRIDDACKQPRGYVLRLAKLIEDPGDTESYIASDTNLPRAVREGLLTFYRLGAKDHDEAVTTVASELARGSAGRSRGRGPGRSASA